MGSQESAAGDIKRCCGAIRQLVTREQFFCGGLVTRPIRPEAEAGAPAPDKETACAALRDAVRACSRCGLHAGRTQTVFGEGNLNAALVFIGEAPGREEDLAGRPFVGEAGRLLTKIIEAMGLQRSDVFITNILRCRPPQNRDPQPDEVAHCRPYLVELLQIIKPRVICTLGKHAAWALGGEQKPISVLRGAWRTFQDTPLMPTYHPAYLLRSPADKKLVWQDMKKIRALLDQPAP